LLWQLFSVDLLNSALKKVTKHPMAYADFSLDLPSLLSQPNDLDATDATLTKPITFDFGATPVGQKPTLISLALKNVGVVPVDWVFYFPNDLEVELESWADPGEYTEDQIHQNLILDNNLFAVTPKSGQLLPGTSTHILLSYTHEFAGFHKLPVLFKLKNGASRCGKEVMIQFTGYSVIPSNPFLQIPTTQHTFEPMPVGLITPPVQMFRLMNPSLQPVEYELDLSGLEEASFF
jgi:hypothetical protein